MGTKHLEFVQQVHFSVEAVKGRENPHPTVVLLIGPVPLFVERLKTLLML